MLIGVGQKVCYTCGMNQEVPKGFEAYFAHKKVSAQREKLKALCYSINQLDGRDLSDLEALRFAALKSYEELTGVVLPYSNLYDELHDLPEGHQLSDKLVIKAYDEQDELAAYAQVICSWPSYNSWTIDQLLLHPDKRGKGIGSKLIHIIENLARTAEVKVTSILSIPARPYSESFWETIGYTPCDTLSSAELSARLLLGRISLRKEL